MMRYVLREDMGSACTITMLLRQSRVRIEERERPGGGGAGGCGLGMVACLICGEGNVLGLDV